MLTFGYLFVMCFCWTFVEYVGGLDFESFTKTTVLMIFTLLGAAVCGFSGIYVILGLVLYGCETLGKATGLKKE